MPDNSVTDLVMASDFERHVVNKLGDEKCWVNRQFESILCALRIFVQNSRIGIFLSKMTWRIQYTHEINMLFSQIVPKLNIFVIVLISR